MLKKTNRLTKTREIKETSVRGRGFFNPLFTIKYLKGTTEPRATVVVSTKVSPRAVKRNRIKRILRETIRLNLQKLEPGNYIIYVKTSALRVPEKKLLSDFLTTVLGNSPTIKK